MQAMMGLSKLLPILCIPRRVGKQVSRYIVDKPVLLCSRYDKYASEIPYHHLPVTCNPAEPSILDMGTC